MDADDEASTSVRRKSPSKPKEELDGVEGTIADDEKEEEEPTDDKIDEDMKPNEQRKEDGKENGKEAAKDDDKDEQNADVARVAKKAKTDTADGDKDNKASNDASSISGATVSKGDTVPGDGKHLDHPENWATGDEPATEKQKGFVAVLEKKAGKAVSDKENMGKSEASEIIEELKGQ